MTDSDKTKEQLLQEISDLRNRLSELETALCSSNGSSLAIQDFVSPPPYRGAPPPGTFLDPNRISKATMEREQGYREFADSLPQGVVEFAADGRLIFVNQNSYKMFGYAREDLDRGMYVLQMVKAADRPRAMANILSVLNGSHTSPNEYQAMRKDGTSFPIAVYTSPLINDGRPVALRAIILDVTEQKKAENALRTSEKRFRSLFETSRDGILVVNHGTGEILAANPAACQLYGYSRNEFCTLNITDISAEQTETEISLKKDIVDIPYRLHRKKDATVFPVEITRGYFTEGDLHLHTAFIRDITERKKDEEALRILEEKFEKAFAMNPAAIAITDLEDGRIIEMNETGLKVFGYGRDQAVGTSALCLWPSEEDRMRFVRELCEAGFLHGREQKLLRKSGEHFTALCSADFLTISGKQVILSTLLDITERKRIEEELRESEERLRTLIEAAPEAVFVQSGGYFVYANPAMLRLLGFSSSGEIIGKPVMASIASEYHDAVRHRMLQLESSEAVPPMEQEYLRRDGSHVSVETTAVSIKFQGDPAALVFSHDISARKQAETALREYEKVVEASHDMIAIVDRNYRHCLANKMYLEYRNARREEVIGRTCSEILGSKALNQEVKNCLDRCFLGETIQYEMKSHFPTKGERFLSVFYLPIKNDEQIERVAVIIRDMSERKRFEEAIRRSEKRYRGLFENMPDGLFAAHSDNKVCEANEAFRNMLGYSHDQLFSLTYRDITPEKWRALEETIMIQQVLTRGYSDPYEKEYIRNDGTVFPVELRTHLLRDERGNASGIWAFVRDLTDRKKVETALRESEEKFRRSFELGLIGMAITSPTKDILEVNSEICKILGYERTELLQLTWSGLTHPDDLAGDITYFNQVMNGITDGYSIDTRFIRKDGRVIFATVSAKCLRRPDGSVDYFVALLQDITERKEAEDELKRREKELNQKSFDLQEANTALKVLLRHRDEDKSMLENVIQANVKELVFPYLDKLRSTHLSDPQATYLTIIESGLNQIISPFLQKLGGVYSRFTPTEIQIANLIRSGKGSKAIAETLNVSVGTVKTHRNNIRNKLGLRNKNTNLQTYLLSLSKT